MSTGSRERIEVDDCGDVAIVTFIDKRILEEANIQRIAGELFALINDYGRKNIILHFGTVEYLSSAALGKLITLNRMTAAVEGKLVLCEIDDGGPNSIYETLCITRLNKLFPGCFPKHAEGPVKGLDQALATFVK